MKRIAVFASLLLTLMSSHGVRAIEVKPLVPQKKASENKPEGKDIPVIHVADGEWGNVNPDEIEALLAVVAGELLMHFPGRQLDPIIVSPSAVGPVVLYQKGPANEYQVRLSARERRWAEYVYEFSHELFHILANYDRHAPPQRASHQWFEEALCEAASLHTLKKLSSAWEQYVPRSEWIPYGQRLNVFTVRALGERHRQLPPDTSFTQWFRENGPSLQGNPYLRQKNELVANLFLPYLEQTTDWSAIAYLNSATPQEAASFRGHLANWYGNTPVQYREFVADTLRLFDVEIPATKDIPRLATSAEQPPVPADPAAGAAGTVRH